jgi:hypothetical protein
VQKSGKVETKRDVIDSCKTGLRYWDRPEVVDLEVKVYGDMARVIGLWKDFAEWLSYQLDSGSLLLE